MNRVRSKSPAAAGSIAAAIAAAAAFLAGCAPFDVNVGTNDPLKVDMNMEVHIYQHEEKDEEEVAARESYKEVIKNRRNRGEEIQTLKDSRLVGETRQGLLDIRSLPAGDYGKYVKDTVEAENDDREFLIQHEAAQKGVPEDEVRRMQWRHWTRKSFPGEWIEVESSDSPGKFGWTQKQGAAEDAEPEEKESGDGETDEN